jgi:hypothetical protein
MTMLSMMNSGGAGGPGGSGYGGPGGSGYSGPVDNSTRRNGGLNGRRDHDGAGSGPGSGSGSMMNIISSDMCVSVVMPSVETGVQVVDAACIVPTFNTGESRNFAPELCLFAQSPPRSSRFSVERDRRLFRFLRQSDLIDAACIVLGKNLNPTGFGLRNPRS